jgi:5-methylcytosine-specific restriction endonuclease McrA
MSKKSNELTTVTRKLVYLSGEKFALGIGIYALAIKEAMKAVNVTTYSGHPRTFIQHHLPALKEYCSTHSKAITAVKKERKTKKSDRSSIRLAQFASQQTYLNKSKFDVTLPAFLESFEWRKLRMQALIMHGRKCMCCGATPMTGAVMNVDHIKPRKLFPDLALEINNLQVLCHECNHGKGNWDQTDWR